MKTNVWIFSVIMLISFGLVSCNDDDDKNVTGCLEGTWRTVYSQGYYKEDGVIVEEWDEEDEDEYDTTFRSNGMMKFWFIDEWIEDKYTYKDDKIYLDNYTLVFNVLSLTDTELVLELKLEIENMVLYEKQTLKRVS